MAYKLYLSRVLVGESKQQARVPPDLVEVFIVVRNRRRDVGMVRPERVGTWSSFGSRWSKWSPGGERGLILTLWRLMQRLGRMSVVFSAFPGV